jgi:hypothetical protein
MKTGSSLALICVGAILAFAVTATPSFFNLHTAGWVIMLIGLIGLVIFNRNAAWLGRRTVIRRSYPSGRVERIPVQPYATATLPKGLPSRPTLLDQEDDLVEGGGPSGQAQPQPGPHGGTTEVIEDVYEQP